MKSEKDQNQKTKRELNIRIEGRDYEWSNQFITGKQLRDLAGIPHNEILFLSLIDPWDDELVPNDGKVDLGRPGIENFYIRPLLKFKIDGKTVSWNEQYITGLQLKNLGSLDNDAKVFLKIKGKFEDELINNNAKVNLARPGIEKFYSKEEGSNIVTIVIDKKPFDIDSGNYSGTELKTIGNVPLEYELEQIVKGQFIPMEDNKTVIIKGEEEFISHPKDGQSS